MPRRYKAKSKMIRQWIKKRRRWILIDVNTQKDFFLTGGKACITNRRKTLANVRRIIAWARYRNIPIISTCEVYPNDNGHGAADYCIDGTEGQKKLRYTLLANRTSFPADSNTDLSADLLHRYRQIVLHNRCADPFDEPRIERLLSEVRAGEFILIGAAAESAVKAIALGLLQRGRKVSIITDAVGSLNRRQAKLALRKIKAKGAKLIETKKIAGTSHLRYADLSDSRKHRKPAKKAPLEVTAEY